MASNPNKPTTTRYFLNTLRENKTLPTPTRGMWHEEGDFLAKYASDIDLHGQLPSNHFAHSVPSVYQRPIQFYESLRNSHNPLHDAAVKEWRGLMAVIGLSRWVDPRLEVTHFVVPPRNQSATSEVGATGNRDLHFNAILRNQLPKREEDWNEWWLIRCDGVLLGATSPWTLVYTAAQYEAPQRIPWQRAGLLMDPIRHYDPTGSRTPVELAILHAWVSSILAARDNDGWGMADHLGNQQNLIADALEQWQEDLAKYARKGFEIQLDPTLFAAANKPFSMVLQRPSGFDRAESDLTLLSSKVEALVLSKDLPAGARVHRGIFANRVDVDQLAPEGISFATRDGDLVNRRYVVAEKLFFPEQLLKLSLSPHALKVGDGTVSVPLTPKFFEYFGHSDIGAGPGKVHLTVREFGGAYKVILSLPLQNGRNLDVVRDYGKDDVKVLREGVPGFGLWPNFYSTNWEENFAAYTHPSPGRDDLRVRPLFDDGKLDPGVARINQLPQQKPLRIWQCPRPPIGFALEYGEERNAGLVLRESIQELPEPTQAHRAWKVGVDFGTSSTTVMLEDERHEINLMPFRGRTIFLTSPEEKTRLGEIERNLYPASDVQQPFSTLLYQAAATVFGHKDGPPYTIRFASSPGQDGTTNQPLKDVKWGRQSDQVGESPLTAYLHALVRYVVCEARNEHIQNLTFHWSYPLSLPKGAKTKMEHFWNGIGDHYSVSGGMTVTATSGISESEAVCQCLAPKLRVRAGGLVIAVDVGGGSTDVAFWSKQTLLDQFSFKVAGNDVLDPTYLSQDALASVLKICTGAAIANPEVVKVIMQRPEIYINAMLAEAKDAQGNRFQDPNPRLHPVPHSVLGHVEEQDPWKHFRSMIYMFFTGMAYYLGLHSRSLKVDFPDDPIEIYIGGRGSSLLTWLSNPERTQNVLAAAFKLGLQRPAGETESEVFPKKGSAKFKGPPIWWDGSWPALKTEVARGLLMSGTNTNYVVVKREDFAVGEVGWKLKNSGKELKWDTRLNPEQMRLLEVPRDHEGGHMAEFLGELLVKKNVLEELNLDSEYLPAAAKSPDIPSGIRQSIEESADDTNSPRQPLFAYELKVLMREYAFAATEARTRRPTGT